MPEPAAVRYLTAEQALALAHLVQVIGEGAPGMCCGGVTVAHQCIERLASVPPAKRIQFGQAVSVLSSRVGVALAIGRFTRFADLDEPARRQCVVAWTNSAIPLVRAAVQAIRRLVLMTVYGDPAAGAAVGYIQPFDQRPVSLPWEGPLPASTAAGLGDGPIAIAGQRADQPPAMRPPVVAARPHPAGVQRADVVVIGSGAGGAVAAATLAEAGFEVVILEGGGWHTRADFTDNEAAMMTRLMADGALRTTDDGSIGLMQGETVGGSTTVNWMLMLRTPDFVLDEWAREHGVVGMRPSDMRPVFDEVEAAVHARPVPAGAHSASNQLLLDAASRLGWRARGGTINAAGCIRCGLCWAGCRHDAKQSALVTWLPRALAAGATLHARAFAERIELRERDGGTGTPPLKRVHVRRTGDDGGPTTMTIDAPLVIVAGGAVQTPALLQRSGLGGDAVGQFLRLHPTIFTFGVYDRALEPGTGLPMTTLCDEHLQWEGTDYGFWIETPPVAPWFAAAAMPGFGHEHAARMAAFSRLGVLLSLTRDGADRPVSSGRVTVDRRGALSIRYRLTAADARRVRASLAAMAQLHLAAGAQEVIGGHVSPRVVRREADIPAFADALLGPNQFVIGSAHVNGTCRMGTDRRTSGATPDGERHGVRGLYITDGSLLPTALGVNPQATIMTVARMLSQRLATRHAGVRGA